MPAARRRKHETHDQTTDGEAALARCPGSALRSQHRSLVLVVDDSPHTREMYSEYLSFRGLGVITAPDGESALELALAKQPELIVMDLAMPGINGITVVHSLKRDPRTRRIPVLVLTGHALRAIQEGALEAGADAFLTKPCLPEELEEQVRRLLPRP